MRKIKTFVVALTLGFSLTTFPAIAADDMTPIAQDYKECHQAESVVTKTMKLDNKTAYIFFNEKVDFLFSAFETNDNVYTTTSVNLRQAPTTKSKVLKTVDYGTKLYRLADGAFGWDYVSYKGETYFIYDKYVTEKPPLVNKYGGLINAAKEEIARRESGGDYDARSKNGRYIGRYQLTKSYLNGDYSYANQEKVADEYVANRYGTWEAALVFWDSHGWY